MPEARFPVEMVNGVPVVAAPEEIDITNAGELRTALLESAARRPGSFVVDLTRTQFCDTSGLHALVSARKRALTEGGDLLSSRPAPPSRASSPSQGSTRYSPVSRAWRKRWRRSPPSLAGQQRTKSESYRPRLRPMISFWISVVPPKTVFHRHRKAGLLRSPGHSAGT